MLLCVADRGELHQVEVVGQNSTLLQEIPLFTSLEPINNILLHKVEHMHLHTYFTHTVVCVFICSTLLSDSLMVPCCFQGQALVGSPLSLALVQAEGCALYPNCEVCARARGLGCVWNKDEEACRSTTMK